MGDPEAVKERALFEHQENFLANVELLPKPARACLYFKTGAGKSLAAMMGMVRLGHTEVVVIAPPSTHPQWQALAATLGMEIQVMSHAKFRMTSTRLSRSIPIIADEFHLFGGHQGQGWKKLDKMAMHLRAPLFLLSATPQYNDAERVYCVKHVLDPHSCKGGYLQFLYDECETEQDPFSQTPKVLGFRRFDSAEAYLAGLPRVFYVPDDLAYTIEDVVYEVRLPDELVEYGYNRRTHRMVASQIERMHTDIYQGLLDDEGHIREELLDQLEELLATSPSSTLVFANHASVAAVVEKCLKERGWSCELVTGAMYAERRRETITEFCAGVHKILIGTSTLATGTDGMDKVCDRLVILDDTDDNALRRQLIGRIMPRGEGGSAAKKEVYRFVPNLV